MLAIYSFAHFLVDFSCAFFIYQSFLTHEHWVLCLVLYNFFAFAMQMPFGLLADKLNRNALCAAGGCLLVAASWLLAAHGVAACVTAGIGNAFFHLGGGIDILNQSHEKCWRLGLFISPGAFGIYFGTMLGKNSSLTALPVCAVLVLSALLIFLFARHSASLRSQNAPLSFSESRAPSVWIAAICFFIVVFLRAFAGNGMGFAWKADSSLALLCLCAVVFGKAAGGFLADRFGAVRSSVLTLAMAAVLFLFADIPAAGILAVFLFNMTMPVTLWAMARIFPGAKGFSFGLLTLALFLGLVPLMTDTSFSRLSNTRLCDIALLSAVLLIFALRKVKQS